MNMLSLATTTVPDAKPLELIEIAAEVGYDAIGLRLIENPMFPFSPVVGNGTAIRDVKRALAATGTKVLDVFSFYIEPGRSFAEAAAAIEVAAEVGAKYFMVMGRDPEPSRLRDTFAQFCEVALKSGVIPSLEFTPGRTPSSLQEALNLLTAAQHSGAVLCIDPMHFVSSGGGPADLKEVDSSLIQYIQFNDMGADGMHCMPGEGTLPLRELMEILPATLPLSVEIQPPMLRAAPSRVWAKDVLDKTKHFLEGLESTLRTE